ncbi:MAG: DNA replication/repair protein RecF [Bacteroidota bacterium]
MYLKNLAIVNFKNYEQAELSFSPKINCFIGNNGVGKTNLLDAIFYLSFCKSYFNPIDSQNIRHENDFFVLQGTYQRQDNAENIYCGMKRNNKKQFKRNKKEYEKLSEHIGLLPLVMISPADIRLIIEGSEERRKYMNFVISQYDKQYLNNAINYNKALIQRNALLKQFDNGKKYDIDTLDIWTDKLIQLGKQIYGKRVGFIDTLQVIFQKYYNFISDGRESVKLIYDSQFHNDDPEVLYKKALQKDRILQYSTVGVHKDDLQLELNGHPIKKEGSQGQQKTYLMALKLAQYDFLTRGDNCQPLLLLDDIFDKFDSERVAQIIKLVSENHFGQIFITDTNRERLTHILSEISIDYKIFEITGNGEIRE